MRMRAPILLAMLTIAAPALADSPAALDKLLAGKTPGQPVECILPDLSAPPRIIDGTAIVYWRGRTTYVARFTGGCAALRADRTVITTGSTGQLCRHDEARVIEPGGGGGYGFCTFENFTPYTRAR